MKFAIISSHKNFGPHGSYVYQLHNIYQITHPLDDMTLGILGNV